MSGLTLLSVVVAKSSICFITRHTDHDRQEGQMKDANHHSPPSSPIVSVSICVATFHQPPETERVSDKVDFFSSHPLFDERTIVALVASRQNQDRGDK